MTNERPDLGFGGELDGFDPKAWDSATKKNSVPRPPKEATMQMAEAIGFKSREPKLPVTVNHKIDRSRRTGMARVPKTGSAETSLSVLPGPGLRGK